MGILDAPGLTRSAADIRYATKNAITVDQLFAANNPVILPHRGAGDAVAPENTLEAFRLGASFGFSCVDGGDLWDLQGSNDDLAVNHNATVDYMTTAVGNISAFTPMSYRNLPVDAGGPSGWFGGTFGQDPTVTGGFRPLRSVTFDDVLREFGGRLVLTPECKSTTGVPILVRQIQRYGLQQSVIAQHFNYLMLPQYVAAGIPAMWLSTTGTDQTPDTIAATGAKYVCLASGASNATITSWVNDGRFIVGIYTIGRQKDRTLYTGLGCRFFFSYSPVYFSANAAKYRTTRDTFAGGDFYHGHLPDQGTEGTVLPIDRGYFQTGGGNNWLTLTTAASRTDAFKRTGILLGYMSPFANPTAYSVNVDIRFDVMPTDPTSYVDLVVGSQDDRGWSGGAGSTGFALRYFPLTGVLSVHYASGDGVTAVVNGPTKNTGTISANGTVVHLRATMTPTQFNCYRNDVASTDNTALSWTTSSGATGVRGAYGPRLGRSDTASTGAMVVSFANVILT